MPGEKAALGSFAYAFLNGGNIIARNGAAENLVDKLESRAAFQRLDTDFAVAELPMSAGLFFVPAMAFRARADCFAIGNFRGFEGDFRMITPTASL